jgi:hypothetical protein
MGSNVEMANRQEDVDLSEAQVDVPQLTLCLGLAWLNTVIFYTYPPMKMEQSVPKRRHIKFRRRGITHKKTYNIRNKAKV